MEHHYEEANRITNKIRQRLPPNADVSVKAGVQVTRRQTARTARRLIPRKRVDLVSVWTHFELAGATEYRSHWIIILRPI